MKKLINNSLAFLTGFLFGCSSGDNIVTTSNGCIIGATESCVRLDGTLGIQECLTDHSYGECTEIVIPDSGKTEVDSGTSIEASTDSLLVDSGMPDNTGNDVVVDSLAQNDVLQEPFCNEGEKKCVHEDTTPYFDAVICEEGIWKVVEECYKDLVYGGCDAAGKECAECQLGGKQCRINQTDPDNQYDELVQCDDNLHWKQVEICPQETGGCNRYALWGEIECAECQSSFTACNGNIWQYCKFGKKQEKICTNGCVQKSGAGPDTYECKE